MFLNLLKSILLIIMVTGITCNATEVNHYNSTLSIDSIFPEKNQIIVMDTPISVNKNTKVTNTHGHILSLDDLKPGMKVRIKFKQPPFLVSEIVVIE